jgi:hypothetical protein
MGLKHTSPVIKHVEIFLTTYEKLKAFSEEYMAYLSPLIAKAYRTHKVKKLMEEPGNFAAAVDLCLPDAAKTIDSIDLLEKVWLGLMNLALKDKLEDVKKSAGELYVLSKPVMSAAQASPDVTDSVHALASVLACRKLDTLGDAEPFDDAIAFCHSNKTSYMVRVLEAHTGRTQFLDEALEGNQKLKDNQHWSDSLARARSAFSSILQEAGPEESSSTRFADLEIHLGVVLRLPADQHLLEEIRNQSKSALKKVMVAILQMQFGPWLQIYSTSCLDRCVCSFVFLIWNVSQAIDLTMCQTLGLASA